MSITHFTTTDKHVRQLILISYVGTDVSAMGSSLVIDVEGNQSAHRNFTYNHCPSRGLNLGHSDEKEVHCPLRYLDTQLEEYLDSQQIFTYFHSFSFFLISILKLFSLSS